MASYGDTSLEHIQACQLYPPCQLDKEDSKLEVPFPLLQGEHAKYIGYTSNGTITLTNFRVCLSVDGTLIILPIRVIEYVETREIFFLYIFCKDGHSVRCTFPTNEACIRWFKRLQSLGFPPKRLADDIFAFAFHAWCMSPDSPETISSGYRLSKHGEKRYSFGQEVTRMGFDLKGKWRISYVNEKFRVCASYPELHIVPRAESDESVEIVAGFRSSGRFPSVVWRNQRNGAVIARCSQPEIGWLGWRKEEDENLISEIAKACCNNDGELSSASCKTLIIDARSYAAAVANRAKGGGVECSEYYDNCEIRFMNLANIHSIRKSFQALRNLLLIGQDQSSWLSALEGTKWLQNIGGLLRSAVIIAHANDVANQPVLIHCSDGWDRTSQLSGLAQLMLDPFYRTFEGFQILVEREWLKFGHKFADRCGHGVDADDPNERCPVFLQWLDCVYQLISQFPCAFEFNNAFLVKLVSHAYSCLFGTFLCNTVKEREANNVSKETCSVWALFSVNRNKYRNFTFQPSSKVLLPQYDSIYLKFWSSLYLGFQSQSRITASLETTYPETAVNSNNIAFSKTMSVDRITAAAAMNGEKGPGLPRQSSDPNLHKHSYELNGIELNGDIKHSSMSVSYTMASGKEDVAINELGNICDKTRSLLNGELDKASSESTGEPAANGLHMEKANSTGCLVENGVCEEKGSCDCACKKSTETLVSDSCSSCSESVTEQSGNACNFERNGSLEVAETNGFKGQQSVSTSTTDLNGLSLCQAGCTQQGELVNGDCGGKVNGFLHDEANNVVTSNVDEDGLPLLTDPSQSCLVQMMTDYKARIECLQRQLYQARTIIQHSGMVINGKKVYDTDEILSLPDSVGSEDQNSLASLPTSDTSWENVDSDSGMTLWVPDHAVTHCASCHGEFWVIKRKHHCRNCGNVYCYQCTDYFLAIPDQQLYEKQRVCKQCYNKLNSSTSNEIRAETVDEGFDTVRYRYK